MRSGLGSDKARVQASSYRLSPTDERPSYNQRVTLSYDGYGFAGFQSQDKDKGRTVQDEVEAALQRLHEGAFIRVDGSGRTDQGVHALGQVISFRGPRDWPENELARALNSTLPRDVRAMASSRVADDFHARRSAVSKHYRYLLDVCTTQHAVRRRYAGHTGYKIDREVVDGVAALFLGKRDFATLRNAGTDVTTTVRTVTRSEVHWEGVTLVFDVEGDGFLRKMVRSMVGGLIEAGRGAATVADLEAALDACDRSRWPRPADPEGLYLVEVKY